MNNISLTSQSQHITASSTISDTIEFLTLLVCWHCNCWLVWLKTVSVEKLISRLFVSFKLNGATLQWWHINNVWRLQWNQLLTPTTPCWFMYFCHLKLLDMMDSVRLEWNLWNPNIRSLLVFQINSRQCLQSEQESGHCTGHVKEVPTCLMWIFSLKHLHSYSACV